MADTVTIATRVTEWQLSVIRNEVDEGRYTSVSQFVAEAIREKIRLCEEVGN